MSIKRKINEERRELILKEASIMFEAGSFEEMKVSDLSDKTNISIGTIYSLFGSKEGLYMSYIQSSMELFLSELYKRIEHDDQATTKIKVFLHLKFEHLFEKRNGLTHAVKNNPFFFHNINNEFFKTLEPINTFLTQCFLELNSEFDDETALEIALAFNGFTDGFVTKLLQTNDELRFKIDQICEMYICMITQCKYFPEVRNGHYSR
jgi:AcrR family transcriptional regulator